MIELNDLKINLNLVIIIQMKVKLITNKRIQEVIKMVNKHWIKN